MKKTIDPKNSDNFDPARYEPIWQKYWQDLKLFQSTPQKCRGDKEKLYLLFAFAYPSGSGLHVGHVESKTALDILARYYRMKGKEVFFPVGWDAFGLPAENYAVKTGVHPAITTKNAINTFRKQTKRLGISYDWDNELATNHPEYYRWTQWLFAELYKSGLAYQGTGMVNWCPSCQTVLANEQVVEGKCERCGTLVTQKSLKQWFFKITQYKDELISGLDQLDWPKPTKQQQLNWIGKKEGAKVKFTILGKDFVDEIECFTTRLDTIFGVTFIVVSPELASRIIQNGHKATDEAKNYIKKALNKTEEERRVGEKNKTGENLNLLAINPLSNDKVPVFVADYVLSEYGTGAVMGVPAHDERDFAFAKKFKLPIRKVIETELNTHSLVMKQSVDKNFLLDIKKKSWYVTNYQEWGYGVVIPRGEEKDYIQIVQKRLMGGQWYVHTDGFIKKVIFKDLVFELNDPAAKEHAREIGVPKKQIDWDDKDNFLFCWSEKGVLVNSGSFDGLRSEVASKKMESEYSKSIQKTTMYKLRDWLISRQRYWGAPIPIIYDPDGVPHLIDSDSLPWSLPTDVDFKPTGESPLKSSAEFQQRTAKYAVNHFASLIKQRGWDENGAGWRPEYDTTDTFVDSSWYYLRFADARNKVKFADSINLKNWLPVNFYMIGPEHIVLHLLYSRFFTKFLRDKGYLDFDEPFLKMRHQGMILGPDGRKMSKSKGNVINPDEIVAKFGADTLRIYEMFMGPIEADKPWDSRAVAGIYRFLSRVSNLVAQSVGVRDEISHTNKPNRRLLTKFHQTLVKLDQDIPALKFNTAIAALMEFANLWENQGAGALSTKEINQFIRSLAPLAPFLAEELYQKYCRIDQQQASVHLTDWPDADPRLIKEEKITLPVQINGKVRSQLSWLAANSGQENQTKIIQAALDLDDVKRWLSESRVQKTIYVPGKIISLVVA